MEKKTLKTPFVLATAFGLMCCTSGLVPESRLSHSPESHHGFMLKPQPPQRKNIENQLSASFTSKRYEAIEYF